MGVNMCGRDVYVSFFIYGEECDSFNKWDESAFDSNIKALPVCF